jgi:hypothetical protein
MQPPCVRERDAKIVNSSVRTLAARAAGLVATPSAKYLGECPRAIASVDDQREVIAVPPERKRWQTDATIVDRLAIAQ